MSEFDATPAAEELAKEKGIDLGNVKGSGKDGRILIEDVEKAEAEREADAEEGKDVTRAESGDEAAEAAEERTQEFIEGLKEDKAEAIGKPEGEVEIGDSEQSLSSAEAYDEHPHVPHEDQSDVERSELDEGLAVQDAETDDSLGAGEGAEELAEEVGGADEDDQLLSTDAILSRGERERGFYVIPEQVNPFAKALAEEANAPAEAEEAGEEMSNEEKLRPAQQDGVVDTTGAGDGPSHGESLKDQAPAVADVAEEGGAGTYKAGDEDDS